MDNKARKIITLWLYTLIPDDVNSDYLYIFVLVSDLGTPVITDKKSLRMITLCHCIQLFHGLEGNRQTIVPRLWRRCGKLLPDKGVCVFPQIAMK